MEKSILLQQQVRNNTEDLRKEFLDLKAWEEEMKRKDAEIHSCKEENLPPIRSKKIKTTKSEIPKTDSKSSSKRIHSYDYSSWDKFDVDKACAEIDSGVQIEEVDDDMTKEELEQLHTKANGLKAKGNTHVKKQEWQKAIDCYTEAIKIFNCDATFFANRALCYLKLDNLYSAEADSTVAIQLDESYVKAYHRRALARMELKQYREAKQDIEKLLKLEPSNKEGKSMLSRVNQAILNQKDFVITSLPKDNNISIEKKINKKSIKKDIEIQNNPKQNEETSVVNTQIETKNPSVNDKQESLEKNKDLPHWVPDLEDNFEIVETINKPPHQRFQKPMTKIPITEVNLGTSTLSKSIQQLEAESKKQKAETKTSKCIVDSEIENKKKKKDERVLIEVISEEFNEDIEIPPVPKTSVQFLSNWNKTKSLNFRYKYLRQIEPKYLPPLFKDFLEFDTLNEILQVLDKEFMKRKQPVYDYLENLSNVKRFRSMTLFFNTEDKKVINQLLEYSKNTENKTDEETTKLREKYEV